MNEQLNAPKGQRPAAGTAAVAGGYSANAPAQNSYANQPSQAPRAAPMGPVPPQPGELQRRLSDALQPMPPNPLQNFSPSGHNEQSRPSRDSWMAPGKVMVEDGLENFPPLAGSALLRTPPLPQAGATPSSGHYFEPQAPAEIQRTGRRLPAIEDFPPQAQREWNAHHRGPGDTWRQGAEERRKQGFFGRLTGFGRKLSETKSSSRASPSHASNTEEDEVQLPVFFGRERR
jgi:cell division protein FtsZ